MSSISWKKNEPSVPNDAMSYASTLPEWQLRAHQPMLDVSLMDTVEQYTTNEPLTLDRLLNEMYDDLHRIARARSRRQPSWCTLRTTGLLHEAFIRMKKRDRSEWSCRTYFLADCKVAMQQISSDYMRRKRALKRGGLAPHIDRLSNIPDKRRGSESRRFMLVDALERLQKQHPNAAELVLLRVFCGMTAAEIARLQNKSTRTIARDWKFARSWLALEMTRLS